MESSFISIPIELLLQQNNTKLQELHVNGLIKVIECFKAELQTSTHVLLSSGRISSCWNEVDYKLQEIVNQISEFQKIRISEFQKKRRKSKSKKT